MDGVFNRSNNRLAYNEGDDGLYSIEKHKALMVLKKNASSSSSSSLSSATDSSKKAQYLPSMDDMEKGTGLTGNNSSSNSNYNNSNYNNSNSNSNSNINSNINIAGIASKDYSDSDGFSSDGSGSEEYWSIDELEYNHELDPMEEIYYKVGGCLVYILYYVYYIYFI